MRTAVAAGVSFILSAAVGYVTSVVTAHQTTGALAALGALVLLGTTVAVVQNVPESRRKKAAAELTCPPSPTAVPIEYAAADPTPVFEAVNVDGFTGRQWLVCELDAFMAANNCGYLLVEADAGMGKTAFAAWLVRTRGYLFHFSRLTGGSSTRAALQNLSAQVIKRCRLADGGFVPEWTLVPANFQSLLGRAAARLDRGDALVLVVDGLDEADPVAEGLPFGLPTLLPPRVYVVATYRTGSTPRHVEPSKTVRIGQDDAGNVSDIRAYLSAAASSEPLNGRLSAAGMSSAAFTALLAERSEGVWVYLRYVLAELRDGTRSPGSVTDLPAGLGAYYAEQLGRWRRDADWASGLLPLLVTLGVAGEPLTAATLAELAGGLDLAAVRRWCSKVLRPLLSPTTAGDDRLFEVYHASLRELLRGEVPEGTEGEPLENALELRQATRTAHSRVADRYLELFSGLDDGLSALADDPGLGRADGGYPLRHLARHLRAAGRGDDLSRLLRAEQPTGDGCVVNVWYAAQDAADSLGLYLDDLRHAAELVAETTDRALARSEAAPSLGQEITCALMAASVISRTKSIPPKVVARAVETGLWSPARGLDHARRMPEPRDRIEGLLAIEPYLPGADERADVLGEALASARDIPDARSRVPALTMVAVRLSPDQQTDVFRQALALMPDLEEYDRARAMAGMAAHLTSDVRSEALSVANSLTNAHNRVEALKHLIP